MNKIEVVRSEVVEPGININNIDSPTAINVPLKPKKNFNGIPHLGAITLAILLSTTALAQDAPKIQDRMKMGFFPDQPDYIVPIEPTDEEKVEALKKAYRLNGGSMVSYGYMIDLTDDTAIQKADRLVATVPVTPPPAATPATEDVDWDARRKFMNRTFKATREKLAGGDVCSRNGMHKVVTGSSWRCRR